MVSPGARVHRAHQAETSLRWPTTQSRERLSSTAVQLAAPTTSGRILGSGAEPPGRKFPRFPPRRPVGGCLCNLSLGPAVSLHLAVDSQLRQTQRPGSTHRTVGRRTPTAMALTTLQTTVQRSTTLTNLISITMVT